MRFGGPLPWTGPLSTPHNLVTVAQAVEQLGYEWVTAGEYLLYPKSRPVPMPGGGAPLDPAHNEQEILTLFSWLAGQTTTLRFQPGMLILAYRSPFAVAKQVATLDHLSGGRFTLGVAAGWMRDEFDIYRVPFEQRGKILDEYLDILRALFETGGPYDGQYFTVPESWFAPKPVQSPLPVVIGGAAVGPVLRRVARHGTCWNPYGCGLRTIVEVVPVLKEMLESEGRDPDALDIQSYLQVNRDPARGPLTSKDDLLARIDRLASAGITQLCVGVGELGSISDPAPTLSSVLDSAAWFADEVMAESNG
jgi:probable F420-dependent oxidoreductase